ncbi:pyridoxamine 5'-phosphate oxidase family protein [Ruminococcaceae bacterium OttesenSCG-928-N02]|nr:pyridoxamine 5'-phosphate oxidase family protein [Ruminococcaceae bacterium OttesenSCG-928-N02]
MRKELTPEVMELLNGIPQWYIATTSANGEPNAIPCTFKTILPNGNIAFAQVFMETTVANVQANGRAAVSAHSPEKMQGYQIKGSAVYVNEGETFERFAATVSEKTGGRLNPTGMVEISPERIILTGPGPDCKKEL